MTTKQKPTPTEKQRRIAELIQRGLTVSQVADEISQPERVVKAQISRLRKMGALPAGPVGVAAKTPAPQNGSVETLIASELEDIGNRLAEVDTEMAALNIEHNDLEARQTALTAAKDALESASQGTKLPLTAVG